MRIAFCYNVKRNAPSLEPGKQADIEFDSPAVIDAITSTISGLGHEVVGVEADESAFDKLKGLVGKVDLVFTIAEGLKGDGREAQISLFCEMLGIPYTHSSPTICALTLNKELTKLVVRGMGIATPNSELIDARGNYSIKADLKYPLILKPNKEGSSKGIYDKNVVADETQLRDRVTFLKDNFCPDILIEEFLEGREFTVGLLGADPRVLPIIEQRFDFLPQGYKKIAGYELKWLFEDTLKDPHDAYFCPAKIDPDLESEIKATSVRIFKQMEIRDCARVDYRLDSQGKLNFLEINPLPGLNPDPSVISYFPLSARVAGLEFKDVISEIIASACARWKI